MQPSIPWSSSVSLFVIEMMAIIHSLKCTVPFSFAVPLLSLAVTHCHSLSLFVTHFHSLSLAVPLFVTRCHSLSLVVPLVVTRCHSLYHSLSLAVIRCHSLSLVVTRCTTRLSFYKRSSKNIIATLRIVTIEKSESAFLLILYFHGKNNTTYWVILNGSARLVHNTSQQFTKSFRLMWRIKKLKVLEKVLEAQEA